MKITRAYLGGPPPLQPSRSSNRAREVRTSRNIRESPAPKIAHLSPLSPSSPSVPSALERHAKCVAKAKLVTGVLYSRAYPEASDAIASSPPPSPDAIEFLDAFPPGIPSVDSPPAFEEGMGALAWLLRCSTPRGCASQLCRALACGSDPDVCSAVLSHASLTWSEAQWDDFFTEIPIAFYRINLNKST